MVTMTDAMVDIETTGTNPGENMIIQIAAVKFNVLTGEVSDDIFDRCLQPVADRAWDGSTLNWWNQKGDLLRSLMARAEPVVDVLRDFQIWAGSEGQQLRFWSKPLSFDWPFIASYFADADIAMPFHYRTARDVNTHISCLVGGGVEHRHMAIPFVGVEHNAVYDCVHQIKQIFAARREAGVLGAAE